MTRSTQVQSEPSVPSGTLTEIVTQFRRSRRALGEEWTRRIAVTRMLSVLTEEEVSIESIELVDNYIDVLETSSVESMQLYARNLSRRIVPRRVDTPELLGIVLVLRDVLARGLLDLAEGDAVRLRTMLSVFEPVANRIATTVAEGSVQEHERLIRLQQDSIRQLSTPVLQVRDRLLIHPIIGVVDGDRARQITEQLLASIRAHRATVVVMDLTGVPSVDAAVANHLVQTVEAARLLGASMIVTGLSPDLSRTLVTIGVDLSSLHAVGDLQGGIEEAEAILGLRVVRISSASGAAPAAESP